MILSWPLKTVIESAGDNLQWVDLQNNQLLDSSLDAKHTNMDRLKQAVEKAAIESRLANDSNQL